MRVTAPDRTLRLFITSGKMVTSNPFVEDVTSPVRALRTPPSAMGVEIPASM